MFNLNSFQSLSRARRHLFPPPPLSGAPGAVGTTGNPRRGVAKPVG